ncbi:hypothetical protein HY478_01630 [Candidatus Uhrbacteria bacterium]|nr:hypothetical protein [Candidatus Uhrbacteria bacterium]
MSDVRRKKGESFESFYRRFQRRTQDSGKLIQAKRVRFHASAPTKSSQKQSALHRIEARKRFEYLAKIGKLPPARTRRPSWR